MPNLPYQMLKFANTPNELLEMLHYLLDENYILLRHQKINSSMYMDNENTLNCMLKALEFHTELMK